MAGHPSQWWWPPLFNLFKFFFLSFFFIKNILVGHHSHTKSKQRQIVITLRRDGRVLGHVDQRPTLSLGQTLSERRSRPACSPFSARLWFSTTWLASPFTLTQPHLGWSHHNNYPLRHNHPPAPLIPGCPRCEFEIYTASPRSTERDPNLIYNHFHDQPFEIHGRLKYDNERGRRINTILHNLVVSTYPLVHTAHVRTEHKETRMH